jgi:hypothetical protein
LAFGVAKPPPMAVGGESATPKAKSKITKIKKKKKKNLTLREWPVGGESATPKAKSKIKIKKKI